MSPVPSGALGLAVQSIPAQVVNLTSDPPLLGLIERLNYRERLTCLVTIGEDAAATPDAAASCERCVEAAGGRDLEARHAP